MNKIIAQKAEEAAQESMLLDNDTNLEVSFEDKTFYIPANFIEKFAELIVRECAGIVNSLEQYEGPGDCSTAEYIKEHFGV